MLDFNHVCPVLILMLGRGAFATVNVGYFHEQKVAVKMLHPNILSDITTLSCYDVKLV